MALRIVDEGRRGRSRPVAKYVGEVVPTEPEPPAAGEEEEGPEAGDDVGEEEEEGAGEGEGETGSGTATGGVGAVTAGGGGRGGVGAAGGGGAVGIGSEIVGTETVTGSPTSPSA